MPKFRRLLTCAVLALVVVVGVGLGRAAQPAVAASVTGDHHASHARQAAPADHGDDAGPCVVRPECGGVWAFGAAGLLLAVVVTVPAVGFVATGRRIAAAPTVLHSALLPSGLFRPPQPS